MNDVLPSAVNLRIVADENIPCVEDAFGHLGTIDRRPGREIDASNVREADVLLVRSVTPVGADLLNGSSVQFVGSATSGTDHVDQVYLAEHDIAFHHAPGSNADSVADYVIAAMVDLEFQTGRPLDSATVGIVGCGNVGERVARRGSALGTSVLCNDPPRVKAGDTEGIPGEFVSLDEVLQRADVVTLHVPLTLDGEYPTHHLIDADALARLKPTAWFINTARGSVVDGCALLKTLHAGQLGAAVLDVWEREPTPDEELIRAVDVATPHIAGYAYDGKVRATVMLYEALCAHLEVEPTWTPPTEPGSTRPDELRCTPPDPRLPRTEWLQHLIRQAYDLQADDARMRGLLERTKADRADYFGALRATYPRRREFQRYAVRRETVPNRYRGIVEHGVQMSWE